VHSYIVVLKNTYVQREQFCFVLASAWRRGGTTYPVISEYAALQYSETGIEHKELTGLNNHAMFCEH
jgi:hypothetical protein